MSAELRTHQAAAQTIATQIVQGLRDEKTVTAYVTPGGGKTLLASVFAHTLIQGGDADHVLVIVPRDSLRQQMADSWTSPVFKLFGGIAKGHADTRNMFPSARMGYVTTYQDVAKHSRHWQKVMSSDRWVLVLDESHHLPDGQSEDADESGWSASVAPLVAKAKRVLCMSGTLVRESSSGRRERLAFIQYIDGKAVADISFTRRDALSAKAILNVSVKLYDGSARYWHRMKKREHLLSDAPASEESRALSTLLADESFRHAMLDDVIGEWATYRDTMSPRSRMIVVCASQEHVKQAARHIEATTKWKAVKAISDEPTASKDLRRFRDNHEGDILVTCQMAYEGLDVPDVTHIVCLTRIRNRSWLEQMFSRATRFDKASRLTWAQQCAFLYAPNDPKMVRFLSEWIDEQDTAIDEDDAPQGALAKPRGKSTFMPESCEATSSRYGDTLGVFPEDDQHVIRAFDQEFPKHRAMPAVERLELARRIYQASV
jgi:superfamily II DNA or RNA helicase